MKKSIIVVLITLFFISCSWFSLEHSNPIDPEYTGDTGDVQLINGLISWYELKNDANDSHSINDGIISGDVSFDDESAYFDGTSDFINTLTNTEIPSECTFALYLNTDLSKACQIFGSVDNPSGGKDGYSTNFYDDGSISFVCNQSNIEIGRVTTSENIISVNTWNFIVFTVNESNTAKIFLNGTQLAETEFTDSALVHDTYLMLGRACNYQEYNDLIGNIKDFAIWNRALTLSEIQYLQDRSYSDL